MAAASRTSSCPARGTLGLRERRAFRRHRPVLEKGLNPGFFGVDVFRHGLNSLFSR